jgi:non-ribosomal peptide synthetase component F
VLVGDRIAVMLNRDSKLITTIYGILKSGGVFVTIDPRNPKDRLELMLKNCGAKYIITNTEYLKNNLLVDDLLNESNVSNSNVKICTDDLAYVMFTSGSNGESK